MAIGILCIALQRVILPIVLILSALIRPVGISFVYLLMFFISPFIPIACRRNFKFAVTAYLIILIAISVIVLLCHIGLQVAIVALNLDEAIFGHCSFTEQLLRHIGFIDARNLKFVAILEWLAPEVMVCAASVIVYVVIKRLTTNAAPASGVEGGMALENLAHEAATLPAGTDATTATNNATHPSKHGEREERFNFDGLIKISPLFCLATLFFAAVLRPSVPGGFYFLIFLLSGSYWATFQSLNVRGFAIILRSVMVVIILHMLCIVAYQTPWLQEYLSKDNLIARLIGLEPLVTSSCANDIRIFIFNNIYKADSFINPIVLSFTYYAIALTTKNLIKPRIIKPAYVFGLENGSKKINRQLSLITQSSSTRGSKKESNWKKAQRLNVSLRRETRPTNTTTIIEPTETTPLVRHASRKTRNTSQSEQSAQSRAADTAGSGAGIPLDNLDGTQRTEDEGHSSFMDQITYGIISIGGFIYQNSYIFTNILMMAWSIVYHSWLTFVLLLWGNLLWMIPNQRKAMMRSSPFIAFYAELLLIAQYIYGMDLTNDELPSKVDITGINLHQIGFQRPQEQGMQPCVPLIVKTLFVLMFWVTVRQFFKEKSERRRTSAIADMIAPLQLTLGSTGEPLQRPDAKKTSKFLKKTGAIIKNLLVRMWMWLLVLVIFLCAITGQRMTGFRICYMGLFLFFLLVFQSSSKAWVKIMYGFWLFLIFYAMSILILIYTYQFDKFDEYWDFYLNISKTLQEDIGLQQYKTKELFLHLLSPTIIVILTVIQVHYFHKRFIESLEHPVQLTAAATDEVTDSAHPKRPNRVESRLSSAANKCPTSVRRCCSKFWHGIKMFLISFKSIFWPFLELHILKVVYIVAFVCSASEVCVLHIAFVALCVMGVIARPFVQMFISRIISFIVTVIILTKMVYQVAYLDHSHYDVHCTHNNSNNETENNAVWFGLNKATETGGLMSLLKQYIIYMVVVTLHAVVSLRQLQMRLLTATQNDQRPDVLFPEVKRADAEKNLKGMIKYFFNYGFYKFGMEICLISIVITVVYRQDVISVVYVASLVVLLCFDRAKSAHFLRGFQYFIAIMIFVQYVFLVGLPPGLCLNYPWLYEPYGDSIQRWAMLPGNLHYNHSRKLILDFIMLMFVNRQCWVFALENRLERNNEEFPGGSNKSVVDDIANLFAPVPFDNPTRDFLSHIRNYLDIFKNAILCGFYWVTLAIVFLAGTNISDFMALGYLIGAFVFLWHGSDFYLRPIHMIIKRWQYLIYYNVFNIVMKTCLQMAGCLFMKQLTNNCCWLIHLLGIVCASNEIVKLKEEPSVATIIAEPVDECPDTDPHHFLLWDALCFTFLILQLRIFKSHYFCHIIIDTRAISNLASRGAELIEDLRQKQIMHRHAHEKEVLHKIKRKMEKIRATQAKMLRPLDKPTHFDGNGTGADDSKDGGNSTTEAPIAMVAVPSKRTAPIAHQSSFSSCQGSGYQTPDDDESDDSVATSSSSSSSSGGSSVSSSCGGSRVASPVASTSSEEQHAQLLDSPDLHLAIPINDGVDYASETQTIYADVISLTTNGEPAATPDSRRTIERLRLPTVDIHVTPQQTTPSSEINTMPFEGFLDANRLSVGSAPASDLSGHPLQKDSDVESEVFSPTPYVTIQPPSMHNLLSPLLSVGRGGAPTTSYSLNVNVSGGSSIISSNLTVSGAGAAGGSGTTSGGGRHQRQSSVNAVSWSETVSIKGAPDEAAISAELNEDIPVTLRDKSLHRRHLSVGNASYSMEGGARSGRRRSSNVSWAREESYMRSATRPNSWGPVEYGYPVHGSRPQKRSRIKLHAHAVRAGDYYMFEDIDDKFELDLIDDNIDFLDDHDKIIESEKKMSRRKTLADVWKDIQGEEFRRKVYVRQRSYASAPGSRIGLKIDEEFLDAQSSDMMGVSSGDGTIGDGVVGVRTSTHSEPLTYALRSTSDYFDQSGKADRSHDAEPSTSQRSATAAGQPESRHDETDSALMEPAGEEEEEEEDAQPRNPIIRLLEAFLVSIVVRLNRCSRNYRYVNKILVEEKRAWKESQRENNRLGRPSNSAMFNVLKKNIESDESRNGFHAMETTNDNNQLNTTNTSTYTSPTSAITTTTNYTTATETPQSQSQLQSPTQQQEPSLPLPSQQPSQQMQLVDLIEMPLDTVDVGRTDFGPEPGSSNSLTRGTIDAYAFEEEDFAARDHNIFIEMLISLWYAILSNTDLICYIVVFVNQVVNASIISLALPMMVFLWGTLSLPRPTKTFWVTMIAFTQGVVLLKCIFQYKIIWAKYNNSAHEPLAPAKIFGVELNPHYASYDLVLLLVLFFHRYILKSQGLWKSEYQEDGVIIQSTSTEKDLASPGRYNVTNEKNDYDPQCPIKNHFSRGGSDSSHNPALGSPKAIEPVASSSTETLDNPKKDVKRILASITRKITKLPGQKDNRNDDSEESSDLSDENNQAYQNQANSSRPRIIFDRLKSQISSILPKNLPGPLRRLVNDEADEANALRPGTPPISNSANDQEQHISNTQSIASISDEDNDTPTDQRRSIYLSSLRKFFWNLTKKARLPTDVYALMFLCDFINFFVLLFGFSSFSSRQVEGSGGVATYLSENKVPVPFLIMLLVQFLLIVIDRAIYLRKSLLSKIIFHFCSVIGIHIWMFFVVPAVTERSFYHLAPPIVFYIIKCFYMLLSSYQIKCGFPKRILGNFLTKGFSLVNMLSFKLYMLIPFLYELRTILDWVCIDTTMTIFDWLKMEDIFSEIYFIKCGRQTENDFPALRAQKKAIISKLLMGGTGIIIIVFFIWGPLCIFALTNAVGESNLPYEVSVSIRIGSYDPIYSTINRESMIGFNQADFNKMQSIYVTDSAKYFLSNYDPGDIAAIKLAGNAPSLWSISPPDKERLLKELQQQKNLTARFTYSFARKSPAKGLLTNVGSEITAELDHSFAYRDALIELLQSKSTKEVILPALVPKFLKILNSGETLIPPSLVPESEEYRPLKIRTHYRDLEMWWEISDYCEDQYGTSILKQLPYVDCNSSVVMYTFSDKKFPSTLGFLTGGGIIGVYTTFVFLASRFIKGFFSGQNRKIMFEDLPYVDRVLQLCLDIYLVREALEFALEEDLFAKLIFLYRSPETLIKWTRPKEEINDDETDTESLRSRRPEQPIQH